MNEAQLERLALLVEECAEVQQIAMKCIRHGYESHHPNDETKTPNVELLEKELGDLRVAVQLMEKYDVDESSIRVYAEQKKLRVRQFLHHNTI